MEMANDVKTATRTKKMRGGFRVNSRVRIAVEWIDDEKILRAEGYTMDIGSKGCLAIVPQRLAVGQKLRIINLLNGVSCPALLIWRGHEGSKGWELGLELENAPQEFWGLEF
jgi:hypothetical protein